MINTTLRKSTKIAMEEIRTGAVAVEIVPEGEAWPPQPAYDDTAGPEVDALGPLPEIAETAAAPDPESMADAWTDTSGEIAKAPEDETPVAFRPAAVDGATAEQVDEEGKSPETPVAFRPQE
ncbi:MAG: hypothetical protein OXD30_06350 [Bryobacterales bacterium]|nr:hypothetical protein [Bryobacterales bacterium]